MRQLEEVMIVVAVFGGIYFLFKVLTDFFLKKKLINTGHVDKAGILETHKATNENISRSPSLKWGLIAFFAGVGLIITEMLRSKGIVEYDSALPFGILLISISIGFLLYYIIMINKDKKNK